MCVVRAAHVIQPPAKGKASASYRPRSASSGRPVGRALQEFGATPLFGRYLRHVGGVHHSLSVERAGINPVWEVRSEILDFRLGRFRLGEVTLKAFTLVSNPFVVDAELAIPMAQAAAQDCRAVVISAMPI